MPTDLLVRSNSKLIDNQSNTQIVQEMNQNPFSHKNLSVVKKLSKGKYPVYLTTSKINLQNYIMKVFTDDVSHSDTYYKNEAHFAYLNHPNVIKIVHSEGDKTTVHNGRFLKSSYIVSEYASHGDFFDFIMNHKNEIDDKLIRTYFRQLIDGLEYLHNMGVAHLDLKPENLLLGSDFNLKIADFDLSHSAGDNKIYSNGTAGYRGPEFYNHSSPHLEHDSLNASDIYSAGIILFVLKSGGTLPALENHPVYGAELRELMNKKSSKFWTKHCEIQGKSKEFFDSKFRSLFHKMVKPNPKQRATIKKIKQSKWYNGPVYSPSELSLKMKAILKC